MLLQFRTTTARTVGVLLDLVKLELRCWLNGNSLPNKTKAITKGKWYPCVQIKEKGNHVVLNPFAKITPEIEQQVPHLYPKLKSKHVTVSEQEKLKIQEARQCVLCPYCEVPNASRVAQQSQVLQRQSSLSNASS